jgi:GAF domain-containing protein/HAMP domain-containing protein
MRITTVIPLTVGIALALVYVGIAIAGSQTNALALRDFVQSTGRSVLSMAARSLFGDLSNLDVGVLQQTVAGLAREQSTVYVAVRDASGRIQAEEPTEWDTLEGQGIELAAQAFARQDVVIREEGDYLILCGPISQGAEQAGTLEIVYDQVLLLQEPNRSTRGVMLPLIAVLSVASVLAVTVITHRATRPLRALAGVAEEIGRGKLDVEVPIRGLEETAVLGRALERMRVDLQALYQDLEQQVADLERRTSYLEATAAVAQEAASVLQLQELLSRATTLISRQLGFYHSGIFLVDSSGEWAVLEAASSEGGRRMQERGHRLQVGGESVVGYVSSRGRHRIVSSVGDDAPSFDNPDLPAARSEIALPLRARGEIIGVLDVQSLEPRAFDPEDVAVLQTLADQLAMAISNARLFQQAQAALEAERRSYGEFSRRAWAEALRRELSWGYYCDANGVRPLADEGVRPLAGISDDALIDDGGIGPVSEDGEDMPTFSIPISARGQEIGTMRVRKSDGAGEWTAEEITLLETVVDQLGVALEGAQLYQETRQRAAREQIRREATDSIRRAVDMDGLMRSTLENMIAALGVSGAFVRLSPSLEESEGEDDASF